MDKDIKKNRFKRFLAVAVLLLIAVDIVCLIVNAFTAADTGLTLVFLFFLIVVPSAGYIFLAFYNATVGKKE